MSGVTTRVFTAEHLAAICLQVGRARDHDRIERFIEAGVLDSEQLKVILRRHGLLEKWHRFSQNPRQRARRRALAALPVGEKLRMLEEMIADTRAIVATHPPKPANPVRHPRSR